MCVSTGKVLKSGFTRLFAFDRCDFDRVACRHCDRLDHRVGVQGEPLYPPTGLGFRPPGERFDRKGLQMWLKETFGRYPVGAGFVVGIAIFVVWHLIVGW